MTLAQLLKNPVLLSKSIAISGSGIVEKEARLIEDRDFVCIFQLSPFIPANDCFVDECTIAGQVFNDGGIDAVLVLAKDYAMAI